MHLGMSGKNDRDSLEVFNNVLKTKQKNHDILYNLSKTAPHSTLYSVSSGT